MEQLKRIMSSGSELDDDLLQVAGQAKGSKRKRARQAVSDSDEDVSLDEESDLEEEYLET